MRTPPLFTGKTWIGNAYEYPLPNHVESHDAQLIQKALLNNQDKSLWSFVLRIFS